MLEKQALRMPIGITKIYKYFKRKIAFNRNNPGYFSPDGLTIFVGSQGSGKTLSAVQYVINVLSKYPNCKLVTNVLISDFPIVSYYDFCYSRGLKDNKETRSLYVKENRVFAFNDASDLETYKNDSFGVLFFIDEIQLYFNSLESKNINMDTMAVFSQQRKQRLHIVATSQVFGRMAKPLREQFSNVIKCRCIFGMFQINKLIDKDSIEETSNDMKLSGKCVARSLFFHDFRYYDCYDTYYVINKQKFISNELKKGEIYDTQLSNSD